MQETSESTIENLLEAQRNFFGTHTTKNVDFRINQLKKFKVVIKKNEKRIADALYKDLHKPFEEAYLTEISIVLQEIKNHLKNLKKWSKPKKVPTPIHLLPSKGSIIHEPLGVTLIIAPWNYPFQLLMNPLVGTISAGCCAILKPSEFTPNTTNLIEKIFAETFDENYIALVQGGKETGSNLLKKRWDLIFFTGSTAVGKIVMKSAAEHLSPVILELGGKSPCIIDKDANLDVAAKRIAWGKTINAGQTCIAPDYLFVHENVKKELFSKIKKTWKEMYGEDAQQSKFYARIVHGKAFSRLKQLLNEQNIEVGGHTDEKDLYFEPTIVDDVKIEDEIMQQEIFGPVLPVMEFSELKKFFNTSTRMRNRLHFIISEKKKMQERFCTKLRLAESV